MSRRFLAAILVFALPAQASAQQVVVNSAPTINPGDLIASAQVKTSLGNKIDAVSGQASGLISGGGIFTTPAIKSPTITGGLITGGSIAAEIISSTVNGVSLATLFQGLTRNQANGVAGLGADGKIPSSLLGALDGSTINGQPLAAAISASGGTVTDVTNLHVTVNGASQLVGAALSSATTAASAALPATSRDQANGVAGLGSDGKVIPSLIGALDSGTVNGQPLATAISAAGSQLTDVTSLHVTVNGSSQTVGPALSNATTLAAAALPAASAGPLAKQAGSSASAAAISALGFTPYNSSNPSSYVTAAGASAGAPVQSVVNQQGNITSSQIAAGLSGQNLSSSIIGGGKTGTAIQSAQIADEQNIAAVTPLAQNALQAASFGQENITSTPIGNQISTRSSLTMTANAASSTQREFMVNLGLTSNIAQGVANADKVTLYSGVDCQPGSGNCWASNFLMQAESGYSGDATAGEFDGNNSGADAPLYTSRILTPLGVNGTISGTTNYMSAGFFIGSVASKNIFHYGVALANNAAKDAAYFDSGNSTSSYLNNGPHSMATYWDVGVTPISIDAAGTYATAAISTQVANTGVALFTGAGQRICIGAPSVCFYYNATAGTTVFTRYDKTPIMSLDANGNLRIAGTITQNASVSP